MNDPTENPLRALTHPQKRIWHVEKLFPNTPLHNLAGTATYRGDLSFATLEVAFNRLIEAHDATRIRLLETPGDGVRQRVAAFVPVAIPVHDFSHESAPRAAFHAWLDRECARPFELDRGPLFRVEFFRLAADEGGYFVNCHHLVSDGWSFQVLAAFVSRAYRECQQGGVQATAVPSYFDLARDEQSFSGSEQFERSRRFWMDELRGAARYPADASGTIGRQLRYRIPRPQSDELRRFATEAGASIATLFTALLFLYLWKREGRADLVIGMPLANRSGQRKKVFGMFASTMPLRMKLREEETLGSFVRRVQETLRIAFRHQRYPYDLLLRDLGAADGRPQQQLFQTCVNFYNTNPGDAARIGDEHVTVEECFVGHQLFPLYVIVKEWTADDCIELHVNYKPALYSEQEIERLPHVLMEAFSCAAGAPAATLAELPVHVEHTLQATEPARGKGMTVAGAGRPDALAAASSQFPPTRPAPPAGSEEQGDREDVPFGIPARARDLLARTFGADQDVLDAALAAAVCFLVARSASLTEVTIGVSGPGERPLRELSCSVPPEAPFKELVESVRRGLSGSSRRSGARAASFGVVVHLGVAPPAGVRSPVSIAFGTPDGAAAGAIGFDRSLYDRADIELLASRLLHTLEIAAPSTVRLDDLEVVGEAERRLLDQFNDTAIAFDDDTTVVRLFERTARTSPEAIALRGQAGNVTYARLNERANQLARTLRAKGVGPSSIVPVMLDRSPELLVGILGVLKAGGAYLPIDASYPESRVSFMIEDSQATLVVSRPTLLASTARCEVVSVDDAAHGDNATDDLAPVSGPEDLAYVCYTSGSTGAPKGALIEHRSLVNRLQWMQRAYPLTATDVLLQKTSISFDVAGWELLWWGMAGASLCLAAPGDEKSPERLVECIEQHGVTVIHFVPSMLHAFLKVVEHEGKTARLDSLRQVFASGEALRPEHVDTFNRVFDGPRVALTNLYGPTEATIDVTYYDCPSSGKCERVPIGRPIDNTRLRVLSPSSRLQPVGAPGELYIGGVGVARGYWNRLELTENRFVPDPYESGERLYRTGDFARWLPNGEIEFLGRKDDQVKLRGFRIELGEIEAALRQHASVEDAAVVVRSSSHGSQQLCAYVVLRDPCTMEQLREHLGARLPDYMVPSWIQQLDALPLGPNGKVNRGALPSPARFGAATPPETPSQSILVEIWSDVLDTPVIGVDDNFFALGGDSIKIISLLSKARARGLCFTTQDVFRHPTIRELASVLTGEHAAVAELSSFQLLPPEDRAALPASAEDAYPLSVLQAGLIYQSQINRDTPFYHDVFTYRIKGTFDAARFGEATRELCRNHVMFRTTFHLLGFSEAIQIVHRDVRDPLEVIDLRGMDSRSQELAVERDISRIRNKDFDWEVPGNLIGFHVHVLSASEYLYTIDFHDSALDGWSVNLIHRELFETYFALLAGKPKVAPARTVQFRDFVALERSAVASQEDKDFWTTTLAGSTFTALPRWPMAKPPAADVSFHEVQLPGGLSDRIKEAANALGVPIKTVLLAAHVHVLSVLTGERDILTGYEYGGRPEASGGESVVGLFLNTLPLRIETPSSTWAELVRKIYRAEADFIAHRRYPMAQIKRDRGARNTLFETVFNFTHFHVLSGLKGLPGFELTEVKVRAETEFAFRAECSVHPFSDEVLVWIHYHADAFPPEQIEAIGELYTRALQAIVRDPFAPSDSQSLLSDGERKRQLEGFNPPERPLPAGRCLHHLFEERAAETPDRVAGIAGGEHWTFDRLNRSSNKIAHALRRLAPGSEAVVAVAMQRDLTWMATVLACFKAGCVYLPLDLDHPAERIATILAQSGCRVVVAGNAPIGAQIAEAVALRAGAPSPVHILLGDEVLRTEADDHNLSLAVSHDHLAYVIFTSGSTGAPKGAMIEHGGMLNHLLSKVEDLRLHQGDVIVQNSSQCFDISLWQLLSGLLVGARVVIYPNERIADPAGFIAAVRRDAVSILEVVPSYLAVLLELLERAPPPLDDLRFLLVTGEPVKVELLQRWFATYPKIPVVNAYGPTEASDDICHHIMTEAPTSALVPVGKPIRNLNVYVLDARLSLVPIGTSGEVYVSGVGVGRGYMNDAVRTEAAFLRDPFRPQHRMYKTGDNGRWLPDGVLELAGRKDDQVKVRGYRIETGEIEGRLQQCQGIRSAAVILDRKGASLVAFVVSPQEIDGKQLKRELGLTLPEYMIPARFIRLDALPLTAHGKIAKQKLSEQLETSSNAVTRSRSLGSGTEKDLARLWADVLKIDVTRIGPNSDFFEMGGHSLKAMELSLRAKSRFSINDLMKYPVLEDLALQVDALAASGASRELLVSYSSKSRGAKLSIVGFSYAGGNACNFQPLFDSINERSADVACYAVEIPRQANAMSSAIDLEKLAQLCVDEIRRNVHTPIVIWGHCSGSALALEVARLLEANRLDLRQVFLGGKVIQSRPLARARSLAARVLSRFMTVDVSTMTAKQIKTWMIEKTGFEGFDQLSDKDALFVTDAFRQDASAAARYIEEVHFGRSTVRLKAPIVNVVATDDPLTKRYRSKYKNWRLFSDRVELSVLEGGGHYFIKTRPKETTALILKELERITVVSKSE